MRTVSEGSPGSRARTRNEVGVRVRDDRSVSGGVDFDHHVDSTLISEKQRISDFRIPKSKIKTVRATALRYTVVYAAADAKANSPRPRTQ